MSDPFEISKGRVQRGLQMAAMPTQKYERFAGGIMTQGPVNQTAKAVPQQLKPYGPRALKRLKRNPS